MKYYTWDEIYDRAIDCACGSPELKAKDTARYDMKDIIKKETGEDIDKAEVPEDVIEDFLRASNFTYLFNENGNMAKTEKKEFLTFRMYADILFNRPIDQKDYISPGGYTMTMDGKKVEFDFDDFEGSIDKYNPCILHSMQKNPSYSEFDDLKNLTKRMMVKTENINEFFVYTGEAGESNLEAVAVKRLYFEIVKGNNENYQIIEVPQRILKKANVAGTFYPKQDDGKLVKLGAPENVGELKKMLDKIPDFTPVYVDGTQGYLYFQKKENYVLLDTHGFLDESEE